MIRSKTTALMLSSLITFSGFLTLASAIVLVGNSQPAQAGWADRIPVPTGIYFEINGKKFYLGDYSTDPNLVFPGSKWEVKINGRVVAHGYGETPGWVVDQAKKIFGI
ncbi:MAG: hypothetical protein DCF22_22185 [Leptolyngbya sp.]|nr:MAG: hypothetical protein DCF22_22185 [Leptolyngbya sp.]